MLGVLATCLFYGDAMITPAISVLSAVEGLTIVEAPLQPLVVPISIAILIGLFLVQSRGTAKVGALFGPVILIYLATIALLGVTNIIHHPEILAALSPHWAVEFFIVNPKLAFLALGSVFLAVTGAETLYADMGHFGRKAIAFSWLGLVYPCLAINYLGQGALMLGTPSAAANPFYLMAPEWARLPLVFIATAATIIASQAVISGAFSVTHQAVAARLPATPEDGAHQRESVRADLHSERQLGPSGDGHRPRPRLPRIRQARFGLRDRGHRHDADHDCHARLPGVPGVALEQAAGDRDDRRFPPRGRHLFRFEHHEDPGRRVVPAARRGGELHRPHDLGQGPRSDARAAAGIGASDRHIRQIHRCIGPSRARHVGVPVDLGRIRSLRRCFTTSSTTRCFTSA